MAKTLVILIAVITTVSLGALAFWSPDDTYIDVQPIAQIPAAEVSSAGIDARVRLIQRYARQGRLNDANEEARALMARAPKFSVRRWVMDAYAGIRREDELESDIRLLVGAGLPEFPRQR